MRKRAQQTSRIQATVQDVARAAGVSTASVSRALNNPESVSPELRARIDEQVKQLGYVRHGAARSLRSLRSFTIGAVIPTLENAIFAAGVEALERQLYDEGYTLLVAVSNYDLAHEALQVRRLLERGVDGMMLVGREHLDETEELLERSGIAYVNTWTYTPGAGQPCVGFDNVAAARQIGEHLLSLGHRNLAMIAGRTQSNDRARERVEGVRAALAAHGLTLEPDRILEVAYGIEQGREAMNVLMQAEHPPTAVICGNDVIAYGALFECAHLGLSVPGDVSVTGFDDLPLTSQLSPALTTVHVPSRTMGRLAADYLLSRIGGLSVEGRTELAAELVVRETTGAPRKSG